jgi:hypothetical protein
MMTNKNIIIPAFLTILLAILAPAAAFSQPMIEEIRFESPSGDADRLIFKMNGSHLPKTFALGGERPRIVFDFPGVVPSKKVQNTIQTESSFIRRIRTGIHTGDNPKTRVVLDLQPGRSIDFRQDFDSEGNVLTITVFAEGAPAEKAAAVPGEPAQPETAETAPPAQAEVPPPEPAEPEPAEPAAPEVAEPAEPEPAEPAAPEVAEPAEPEPAEPAAPEVAEPAEPEPAEPAAPEVAEPAEEKPPSMEEPGKETTAAQPPPAEEESLTRPGLEESTVIQPLAEIGEKEQEAAAEQAVPTLYAVEFDRSSHRGEIVAFKLNGFNPPVVFGIEEDIPRIVCFFKDTSAGEELGEFIETDGRFIRNIKIGTYRNPDNIRVVLDLVPGRNYDLQQIFFKEDNLFMVIINTTGDKIAQ